MQKHTQFMQNTQFMQKHTQFMQNTHNAQKTSRTQACQPIHKQHTFTLIYWWIGSGKCKFSCFKDFHFLRFQNTFAPSALGWASLGFFSLWLLIFSTFESMLLYQTRLFFLLVIVNICNIWTCVITSFTLLIFAHLVYMLLHCAHC